MQNVIVFISPDIDYMMRDKIIKVLSLNHIELTNNIDIATLVIQKEKIKKYVPRNISVPEFNTVLQIRKQFLLNRTRRK